MRIRKLPRQGNPPRFIGKFPSLKLDRTVLWGSQLARDYVYLLEYETDVLFYDEQPTDITYSYNGFQYNYTPHFLVERLNKKQLVDIRFESEKNEDTSALLYRILSSACCQEGYDFLVRVSGS